MERRELRHRLWGNWALVIAAAFAIAGLLSASGSAWAVIAVVAGLGYVLITRLTRPLNR